MEDKFPQRLRRLRELIWREKEDTIMNGESKAAKEKLEGVLGQERDEADKLWQRKARQAAKWGAICGGSLWLYWQASGMALAERGYQAVGGEILLLLIPFLYYIIERIYRNFTADIRKFWAECEEDEE